MPEEVYAGSCALGGVEAAIATRELLADGRVAELREAAHGDGVEEARAEQLLANLPQVGRFVLDERLQRGFARGQVGLPVERDVLHFVQRSAIAEDDAQLTHAVADGWIGAISKVLDQPVP